MEGSIKAQIHEMCQKLILINFNELSRAKKGQLSIKILQINFFTGQMLLFVFFWQT